MRVFSFRPPRHRLLPEFTRPHSANGICRLAIIEKNYQPQVILWAFLRNTVSISSQMTTNGWAWWCVTVAHYEEGGAA